jgi:membrane protein insertase Oxa1/YidC/SpoIIIJ
VNSFAVQEKHKGDRETLQKEMMELYRKEKARCTTPLGAAWTG